MFLCVSRRRRRPLCEPSLPRSLPQQNLKPRPPRRQLRRPAAPAAPAAGEPGFSYGAVSLEHLPSTAQDALSLLIGEVMAVYAKEKPVETPTVEGRQAYLRDLWEGAQEEGVLYVTIPGDMASVPEADGSVPASRSFAQLITAVAGRA